MNIVAEEMKNLDVRKIIKLKEDNEKNKNLG